MRSLSIVEPTRLALEEALAAAMASGTARVFCEAGDPEIRACVTEAAVQRGVGSIDESGEGGRAQSSDIHVVWDMDGDRLAERLHRLIGLTAGRVVIPRTDRAGLSGYVFAISPPKAGTHLLFGLLRALGFRMGYALPDRPKAGYWYYLEYTNAHTRAQDFFIDSVRRAPHGNRAHPFPRVPSIIIYRDPRDVVTSESRFYHRDGQTAFSSYLSELSEEERLVRLIDDPWLLGSIRDRVGAFVPWLEFPSVIPVSFEELVGAAGAGSDAEQRDVIWSLLLKLQVAGDPDAVAVRLFDPESPTFDRARIGAHRQAFSPAAQRAFDALPQDFMIGFGYRGPGIFPSRRFEFRKRPLVLSKVDPSKTRIVIDADHAGHVIVQEDGVYRAVRKGRSFDEVDAVIEAPTLVEIRFLVQDRWIANRRGPV